VPTSLGCHQRGDEEWVWNGRIQLQANFLSSQGHDSCSFSPPKIQHLCREMETNLFLLLCGFIIAKVINMFIFC
jgi:hypothetical protein